MRYVGRFVALAAMRDRRQVRRVGLEHDAVKREGSGDRAQGGGVLEREDPGKTDQQPALEARAGKRFLTGKTVHHAPGPLPAR